MARQASGRAARGGRARGQRRSTQRPRPTGTSDFGGESAAQWLTSGAAQGFAVRWLIWAVLSVGWRWDRQLPERRPAEPQISAIVLSPRPMRSFIIPIASRGPHPMRSFIVPSRLAEACAREIRKFCVSTTPALGIRTQAFTALRRARPPCRKAAASPRAKEAPAQSSLSRDPPKKH